jgi:hypothetical protein
MGSATIAPPRDSPIRANTVMRTFVVAGKRQTPSHKFSQAFENKILSRTRFADRESHERGFTSSDGTTLERGRTVDHEFLKDSRSGQTLQPISRTRLATTRTAVARANTALSGIVVWPPVTSSITRIPASS